MPVGHPLADTALVLDNDLFTHWRNKHQYVLREIGSYTARLKEPPGLSSITIFEADCGIEAEAAKGRITKEQGAQYRDRIKALAESCPLLSFDSEAAAIAAYVFPRLTRSERNKHWKDLFTIATALSHGYGVATGNRGDFELIAGHLSDHHPILRLAVWRP